MPEEQFADRTVDRLSRGKDSDDHRMPPALACWQGRRYLVLAEIRRMMTMRGESWNAAIEHIAQAALLNPRRIRQWASEGCAGGTSWKRFLAAADELEIAALARNLVDLKEKSNGELARVVAERLKDSMGKYGLTEKEIANKLHVPHATVRDLLGAKAEIDVNLLARLHDEIPIVPEAITPVS